MSCPKLWRRSLEGEQDRPAGDALNGADTLCEILENTGWRGSGKTERKHTRTTRPRENSPPYRSRRRADKRYGRRDSPIPADVTKPAITGQGTAESARRTRTQRQVRPRSWETRYRHVRASPRFFRMSRPAWLSGLVEGEDWGLSEGTRNPLTPRGAVDVRLPLAGPFVRCSYFLRSGVYAMSLQEAAHHWAKVQAFIACGKPEKAKPHAKALVKFWESQDVDVLCPVCRPRS